MPYCCRFRIIADEVRFSMDTCLHGNTGMAEVFAEFSTALVDDDGVRYHAHVCGGPMPDGKWQGWVEFIPIAGGPAIRSGRETTQPNRAGVEYWATGLTAVYFEGALERALNPVVIHRPTADVSAFEEPAPPSLHSSLPPAREAVLDPFAVFEKEGEVALRRRLAALAAWHLVNIVEAYDLTDDAEAGVSRMAAPALIETIVSSVAKATVHQRRRR